MLNKYNWYGFIRGVWEHLTWRLRLRPPVNAGDMLSLQLEIDMLRDRVEWIEAIEEKIESNLEKHVST